MLSYMIDLIAAYCQSGIFSYVLNYILLLAFVATVPCIIRSFIGR